MFLVTRLPRGERLICRTANDLLEFIIANAMFTYQVETVEFHVVKSTPDGDSVTLTDTDILNKLRSVQGPIPLARSGDTE